MNKKILSKLLIVILLIIIVVNNISYAISVTKDDFKKSIEKIYLSDITIETETKQQATDESPQGTSTMSYTASEDVDITDSKIIIKDVEDGKEIKFEIDYTLSESICTFNLITDPASLGITGQSEAEYAMALVALMMFQSQMLVTSYLVAADAIGANLETAYSYYTQVTNEAVMNQTEETESQKTIVECDVFKYQIEVIDSEKFKVQGNLEVNLEKLSQIDESDLDGKVKTKITLGNNSTDTGNNGAANNTAVNKIITITSNTTIKNNVNNATITIVNNTSNKVNNTNKSDNTIVTNTIPETGEGFLSYIIMGLILASLVMYIRIRQLDKTK